MALTEAEELELLELEDQEARAKQSSAPASQGYIPEKPGVSDYARTAFDQGMQGATFGFSDEITDRVGALIASKYTGIPYDEMLKEARTTTKARLKEQTAEMPGTSIVANLAGGLLTGGAAAETKAGAAVGNSLRTGNLAARVAKGALSGAASGGLYGAGTSEEGKRLEGAGQGAVLGGVVGAATPLASAGLDKVFSKKSPIPNADELRKKASDLYKIAEQKGGTLKPEFTNKFVDEIEKLKPQTDIGKIVGGDSPFTKVVDRIGAIRDKPMTLDSAQELDELLGEAIDGFTEMGRVTKQGKKLLDIQSKLRDMINQADDSLIIGGKEGFDALKQGRKLWATSRKLSDIERIVQRAEQMDQPATGIKSGFRTLLNNPNRIKGFTNAEKAAIRKAADTGGATDLLRTLGSRLVSIGSFVKGGSAAGVLVDTAASNASRGLAERVQFDKAKRVAEIVANQGNKISNVPSLPNAPNAALLNNPVISILSAIRGN